MLDQARQAQLIKEAELKMKQERSRMLQEQKDIALTKAVFVVRTLEPSKTANSVYGRQRQISKEYLTLSENLIMNRSRQLDHYHYMYEQQMKKDKKRRKKKEYQKMKKVRQNEM